MGPGFESLRRHKENQALTSLIRECFFLLNGTLVYFSVAIYTNNYFFPNNRNLNPKQNPINNYVISRITKYRGFCPMAAERMQNQAKV